MSEDAMTSITVWEKPDCPQCRMTKQAFDREGTTYSAADLTAEENADKLSELKDQGYMQAPIVETPSETWSGFDPNKIKSTAAEAHASQPQINQPGVSGPGMS